VQRSIPLIGDRDHESLALHVHDEELVALADGNAVRTADDTIQVSPLDSVDGHSEVATAVSVNVRAGSPPTVTDSGHPLPRASPARR
jgi:hypothetical protein